MPTKLQRSKLAETCFKGVSISEILETRYKSDEILKRKFDLQGSESHNSNMNQKHFKVLDGSAEDMTAWHRANSPEQLDLSGADLSGRDLRGRDFSRANLERADLSGANLDEAVFSEASLRRANLSGASMKKATLYRTNCTGSDVSNADFSSANMYRCVLREANIEGANFRTAQIFKVAWPEGVDVRAYG